jgi:Domain of unknown function (DUF4145)
MNGIVYLLDQCPQCGVANPLITAVEAPKLHHKDEWDNRWWHFTAECSKCRLHILFYGHTNENDMATRTEPRIVYVEKSFPDSRRAANELPDRSKAYLQQALGSLHAPDGAVMLAASSVDSMLKDRGYKQGSLYSRIEKAHADGLLTAEMRDWAHEIRLSANEPRHADDDFAGATAADATQVIEFAEALGEYLFVLPMRVEKWKAAAKGSLA